MDTNPQQVTDGEQAWEAVLESLCRLQTVLPDAVLVGGTASALYAHHRFSFDHVLPDLKQRFDGILSELEAVTGWQTERVNRPVQILGSLDGVETGVRQLRRSRPLETTTMEVGGLALFAAVTKVIAADPAPPSRARARTFPRKRPLPRIG